MFQSLAHKRPRQTGRSRMSYRESRTAVSPLVKHMVQYQSKSLQTGEIHLACATRKSRLDFDWYCAICFTNFHLVLFTIASLFFGCRSIVFLGDCFRQILKSKSFLQWQIRWSVCSICITYIYDYEIM